MKKLLQNKRFILALIVVPNLIIAFLTNGNNALYTLGAALGAATVVYLIYYASRILLSRTDLNRDWIIPVSLACGYGIYYACMSLF